MQNNLRLTKSPVVDMYVALIVADTKYVLHQMIIFICNLYTNPTICDVCTLGVSQVMVRVHTEAKKSFSQNMSIADTEMMHFYSLCITNKFPFVELI